MKEEKNSSSKIQNLMRKRWLLPAVYLAVAAGLLSAVFFMQNGEEQAEPDPTQNEQPGKNQEEPAAPVNVGNETVHMPVSEEADFDQVGVFYDAQAEQEEQEQALVYYDNIYRENKGIDLASKDQQAFPVISAMSGMVTKAMKDSVLGFVIEVDHGGELKTHYSSLSEMEVEQGAEVKQGDVLGEAGTNSYNEEAGVHVHFEIRQDGVAINPADAFNKTVEDLASTLPQGEDEDEDKKENEAPAENEKPENNESPEGSDSENDQADENEKSNEESGDLPE